jgi:hypothetical protein
MVMPFYEKEKGYLAIPVKSIEISIIEILVQTREHS